MAKRNTTKGVSPGKKKQSGWHGGKKIRPSFEGTAYTGGRKEGRKNLTKLDNGNLMNQHGVEFTREDKKRLESLVNSANRKRMKMLEEEANLPRFKGGQPTGQTVGQLQAMGKESDFILSRKSKSMQRFKSREDFEYYLENLKRVNSKEYLNERTELYRANHIKALENAFGDEADDIIDKIKSLDPKEYRKLLQQEEDLEVSYIYDPSARTGKLNNIRTALKMEHSEGYEE